MRVALGVTWVVGWTALVVFARSAVADDYDPRANPFAGAQPVTPSVPPQPVAQPPLQPTYPPPQPQPRFVPQPVPMAAPPVAPQPTVRRETPPAPYVATAQAYAAPPAAIGAPVVTSAPVAAPVTATRAPAQRLFRRPNSTWRAHLEGLYSFHDGPDGRLGEFLQTPTTRQIDFGNLSYDGTFGGRLTVQVGRRTASWIEVRAAYFGQWDASGIQTGEFGFTQSPGLPPVEESATQSTRLLRESEIFTGEINYRHLMRCDSCSRFDVIGGLRFTSDQETARADQWSPSFDPGFATPARFEGKGENAIVHAQLGVGYARDVAPWCTLKGEAKFLVGASFANAKTTTAGVFSDTTTLREASNTELSFGLNLDLGAQFWLTTDVSLSLGYSLLVYTGVVGVERSIHLNNVASGAAGAQVAPTERAIHSFYAGVGLDF